MASKESFSTHGSTDQQVATEDTSSPPPYKQNPENDTAFKKENNSDKSERRRTIVHHCLSGLYQRFVATSDLIGSLTTPASQRKGTMCVLFCDPKANVLNIAGPAEGYDWYARLEVWATDLPDLMQHGFFWSEANVERLRNEIITKDCISWAGLRRYRLKSLPGCTSSWTANLDVSGSRMDVLSLFRVSDLNLHHLRVMDAWLCGRLVYCYRKKKPQDCINTLYDEMPMTGWWPWPRRNC